MEELLNKICTISNLTAETIKSYSKLSDVVARGGGGLCDDEFNPY